MDRTHVLPFHTQLGNGQVEIFYLKAEQYNYNKINDFLVECRLEGADWMRGTGEPTGWANRLEIDGDQWSENWLLYGRDLQIQDDMEWLVETVSEKT
jgi:hypothetical protein